MNPISRRRFINQSVKAGASILALSQLPSILSAARLAGFADMQVGFQTWVVREMLAKDFAGTLKMISGLGYKMVEMCSPAGYSQAGFGSFVDMKPADMRKIINDAGLSIRSCHFTSAEFKNDPDKAIEWAKQIGLSHMVLSSFGLPKTATLKDFLDAADALNKVAEKINKAGLTAGFHNHSIEFAVLEGQVIYDALLKQLDPKLVKMQFQTEVINLGYKASDYFSKYPGRFISAHLSDWTSDKKQVPVGKGVIDWKEFFAAAKKAGVQNYYVEMDFNTFKESVDYIQQLNK